MRSYLRFGMTVLKDRRWRGPGRAADRCCRGGRAIRPTQRAAPVTSRPPPSKPNSESFPLKSNLELLISLGILADLHCHIYSLKISISNQPINADQSAHFQVFHSISSTCYFLSFNQRKIQPFYYNVLSQNCNFVFSSQIACRSCTFVNLRVANKEQIGPL